ncbi:hypothetical protein JCM3765_001290, partial [Sporobolomyces pararoseus]
FLPSSLLLFHALPFDLMEPLTFTDPLPAPTPLETSSKLPPAPPDFLSTPQGELSFFRSIVYHRLVGPEKHFNLLGVVRDIRNHAGKHVEFDQVWEKYREVYNEEVLETTWADQELTAIERDGLESRINELDPPILKKSELESLDLASKPYSRIFPLVEFSLNPEEYLATTAFERGQRGPEDAPDSPIEAPLREIFYEPEEVTETVKVEQEKPEEKKRSPRKRIATPKAAANAAAAIASPRRRRTKQQVADEASGSELSDLTDDDEEEEQDEDEEGGESQDETAGEDGESYLEDGTVASHNGEEEDEEVEEEGQGRPSRKRKAPASRRGSNGTKRTRNARSTSVATSDSRTAADRKKEQATPSTRGRGRAAASGGSVKRPPGRPPKKK